MINPVHCDNQCCEKGMNQDWQPDTINDRSINQTKNSRRMTHCLQSPKLFKIIYPEMSIGLSRLDLKNSFERHAPKHARAPSSKRTIVGNGEHG
jgi:hypothetical protein